METKGPKSFTFKNNTKTTKNHVHHLSTNNGISSKQVKLYTKGVCMVLAMQLSSAKICITTYPGKRIILREHSYLVYICMRWHA